MEIDVKVLETETSRSALENIQEAALLFPDYESLRSGALKELYDQQRVVQEYFEEASHITGLNVTRLLFNASESELRSMPDAYALLFLLQASVVEYISSKNITITHVGGYGLGAYGALYGARAYTFADGLYLVSKWATAYYELLQEKNFKKISVSGVTLKELKKVLSSQDTHQVMLSEKFSETGFAVSGVRSVVEFCEEELLKLQEKCMIIELPLEGGLYADLAPEITLNFKLYLEKVEFKDSQTICFSPHKTEDLVTAQQIKDFIIEQPFLYQDRVQLIERYAACQTIIVPLADEALLAQLRARYPEKNIITLR
jgi:[acyl-carrier-protein] S-malonyltransferase